MRRWGRDNRVRYAIIAFELVLSVACVAAAVSFFSSPGRSASDEPIPDSGTVTLRLHNAAPVPLLVNDVGSYGWLDDTLRLEPGETREVDLGDVPAYISSWNVSFCLEAENAAETENVEPTSYQCLTYPELEGAGLTWELRPDFVHDR